jgi:hypothetical protein
LRDYFVDLSGLEKKSNFGDSDEISNPIHDSVEDDILVIVKSITFRNSLKKSQLEKEIDDLINL